MSASEALSQAYKLYRLPGKGRINLWRTTLAQAAKEPGFLDANAADVVSLIWQTLAIYTDLASQRAVLRFLRLCLHNEAFLKTMAGALVRASGAQTGKQESYILLCWSSAIIRRLDLPAAKKAVSKLAEFQATHLNTLLHSSFKWRCVVHVPHSIWKERPALFAVYMEVLQSTASAGLTRALLEHAAAQPGLMDAHRAAFLKLLCDRTFGAREPLPALTLAAYQPLAATLSRQEFEATVLPMLLRMAKRSPENVLASAATLISMLNIDLGLFAERLAGEMIPQLRHSKEPVRAAAAKVVGAVASRTADASKVAAMFAALRRVLDGSAEGKLRNASERLGLLCGINALNAAGGAGVADDAVDFLCAFYKEEANEEVKVEALAGIGASMARADHFSGAALQRMLDGLKEKDVLRRAHLRALNQALSDNESCRVEAASLAKPLAKVALDGVTKPAQRADALAALLAAASIASADSDADAVLETEKVWQEVSKADSVLLAASTLSKLPAADAVVGIKLAEELLLKHGHRAVGTPGNGDPVPLLIAASLLHYSPQVRWAASAAVAACVHKTASLGTRFVAGLQHWLRTPTPTGLLADPAIAAEDPGTSEAAVAYRFRSALVSIAAAVHAGGGALPADLISRLLLAANHPNVDPACSGSAWAAVRRRTGSLIAVLAANPDAVIDRLFGPEGLASKQPGEVHAAVGGVRAAMGEAADALAPQLLSFLTLLLDRSEAEALSLADLKIFQTSEGELALEVDISAIGENGGVFRIPNGASASAQPALKEKPSLPNGGGPRKFSGGRDALTGGRGRGAGGKAVKDGPQERREKQLQQEAEVRKGVVAIKQRLELGLRALAGAASGDQAWTLAHLEQLSQLLRPLLASPLVGEGAAFDAQQALAASLPGALGRRSLALATALRLVELHSQGDVEGLTPVPEHVAVAESIRAMASVTHGRTPLPLPAFSLCFPILAAVLSWAEHSPLHDEALAVVSLHVAPSLELPRPALLALLYHVLGVIPAYRGKVQPLLEDLCRGLHGEGELLPALDGLLAAQPHVRAAALEALPEVPRLAAGTAPTDAALVTILWLAQHDPDAANAEAALVLWDSCDCHLPHSFLAFLLPYLRHLHSDVRIAAAEALSFGLQEAPEAQEGALGALLEGYQEGSRWQARSGTALALQSCAAQWRSEDIPRALDFLMGTGLADNDDTVRSQMVAAGVAIVDAHGAANAQQMLPVFESYLDKEQAVEDEERYDRVRQGAVVFLGTLARHMEPGGAKVKDIVETLVEVLTTPSAEVQRAVAACLPPLMPGFAKDRPYLEQLIQRLLDRLFKGRTYGHRKGAAFGIAGIVKGLGISAINGYGILGALKDALEDKDDATKREGALLAFESLCTTLGRMFEPYVVQIMGKLLDRFGDGSPVVRAANDHAAQAIMENLSNQGVKLVLPALMTGVDSKVWRAKQGSVQMLGAMAHLAPGPLSTALPRVVPKLSQVLSDPHPKVQAAARQALKEVGSVIRNPEVQKLVPSLLAAIAEPNTHAKRALDLMLSTTFVNTVDAASLALIVPVVHRSLRDRSGDAKKRAARIVGNMCALINEPKDMAPYVPLLIPELRSALIDPLPEVRATAAKALGSLLRGMGQQHFQDLMPWLLQTLKSEGSSVERSGAAQGLAEVLAVLGPEYLQSLLPDILASCTSRNPYVREGHLTLFKFLPASIPDTFQGHLQMVLPAILDGLADEAEGVRDAALAAGRTFVDLYAQTALPLLLPAVEAGIVNDNWRIRQSSVELLGDLLFKVAGTSGKVRLDGDSDDEGISTEAHSAAIIEALGLARRNQILARVYMARSDVGYMVRAAALHVWKTLVTNTPRTLSEILPYLMDNIIQSLASTGEERQQMAGSCLGELVRKMGDRVLRQIVPILQIGMKDPLAGTRVGVCTGLKELLENVSQGQLMEHLPQLLPTVQSALVDSDAEVRQAAGAAFGILFRGGSGSAVDGVIPSMLTALEGGGQQSVQALEGLRVILGVRPQTLATMLPRLLRPPLTPTAMRALAALSEVAGPSIHSHLGNVVPPLLLEASQEDQASISAQAADEALRKVASAVAEEGVYLLMAQLDKGLEDPARRLAAANLIKFFCQTSKLDFQEHVPALITSLVSLMSEEDPEVLAACWGALGAVTATIAKELLASYARCVKDAVATAREKQRRRRRPGELLVPGFCLPKALSPVLPIYLQGVLQGSSAELRELAAEGLGELVDVTSSEALRPFVVQITGPLIRIIGDRFPWQIKAAILTTLGLLIKKAGAGLKPFVPQLQTTFLKCLPDQARQVRQSAAENLGRLSAMSARVDVLANDLVAQARTATPGAQEAYLTALSGVLASSGARLAPATRSAAGQALQDLMATAGEEESLRRGIASCLGEFSRHCSSEELRHMLETGPLAAGQSTTGQRLGSALTFASTAQSSAAKLEEVGLTSRMVAATLQLARDDSPLVKEAVARAAGHLALAELRGELPKGAALAPLVPAFVALLGVDQASEVQRQQLHVLRTLSLTKGDAIVPHYGELVPLLCSLLSGPSGPTKLATERTLSRVLQAADGPEVAQAYLATPGPGMTIARACLTETYLRRLQRLPLDDSEDQAFD